MLHQKNQDNPLQLIEVNSDLLKGTCKNNSLAGSGGRRPLVYCLGHCAPVIVQSMVNLPYSRAGLGFPARGLESSGNP
jgi:hypothetical protein